MELVGELEVLYQEDEHMDLVWEDHIKVDHLKVDQNLEESPKVAILDEEALRRKVLEVNLVVEVVVGIGLVAA